MGGVPSVHSGQAPTLAERCVSPPRTLFAGRPEDLGTRMWVKRSGGQPELRHSEAAMYTNDGTRRKMGVGGSNR